MGPSRGTGGPPKTPTSLFNFVWHHCFQNVWGIIIAWIVSGILTATGVFTDDKDEIGYMARTDTRLNALQEAPWFYFPYPGEFLADVTGKPTPPPATTY